MRATWICNVSGFFFPVCLVCSLNIHSIPVATTKTVTASRVGVSTNSRSPTPPSTALCRLAWRVLPRSSLPPLLPSSWPLSRRPLLQPSPLLHRHLRPLRLCHPLRPCRPGKGIGHGEWWAPAASAPTGVGHVGGCVGGCYGAGEHGGGDGFHWSWRGMRRTVAVVCRFPPC